MQKAANAEGLVMESFEDIDEEDQDPTIFRDQVERCPCRQVTKNGMYCSKKECFFVLKNMCVGCPELPEPRKHAEIAYESLHYSCPDKIAKKEDKMIIGSPKQTVLDMFGG